MRYKLCRCGAVREDRQGVACPACANGKSASAKRTTTERGYGGDWKRLSERYRKEHPLCVRCAERGLAIAADEVHHVVSIDEAPWLRLEPSNLMSLCVSCHRAEDAAKQMAKR
jgi:5-methylcytosine-specific restriction enzyme A